MFRFERILFPVDFSDQCRTMLPYVADLANRLKADLDFLHVFANGDKSGEVWRQRSWELEVFASRIPEGRHLPRIVAYGDPAQTVARYVKARGADIVTLPLADPWAQEWMAEHILRDVSCAVWTGSAVGRPHTRWSPVVCAVDLDSESERVVRYASALADTFHANLIVVHAVPPLSESFRRFSQLPAAPSRSAGQRKLEKLLDDWSISAEAVVQTGSVAEVVGFVTEQRQAELLVIGRGQSQTRAKGALGEHTYGLIANSKCPVVSCPRLPAASAACFWTEWQQESSVLETELSWERIAC